MESRQVVGFAFEPEYSEEEIARMEADKCTEEAESRSCSRTFGTGRLVFVRGLSYYADCRRKVCVAGKMNLRFQRWNRCNTRRVGPITLSERFGTLCLNQDVLPQALMTIHDTLRNGQLENNIQHRPAIFRIKPSSLCITRRQCLCLYYFFTKYLHILCFHHGCCWLYCPGRAWFFMVRVSFRDIKQAILPCKLFV